MGNLKLTCLAGLMSIAMCGHAQITPVAQMENLGRGVVALPSSKTGILVSWRMLGTEDENRMTFDVLRDGEVVASDLAYVTNYADTKGKSTSKYQIVTKIDGEVVETTDAIQPWTNSFFQVHLDRPAAGSDYTYSPSDCSVGDVDGDGEYEIIVKWDPSNAKDNSQGGKTGKVYLDCYKVDWTAGGEGVTAQRLWRVDLGVNIRAGAHYTQFMVYDFDGDGRAEMMCKTAPGSKDGQGNYVSAAGTESAIKSVNNTKDWRNGDGRVDGGYEFLTVFEGLTGKALHTVFYKPNRSAQTTGSEAAGTFNWDDRSGKKDYASYGNRGERYLAGVAYLDGADKNPHAVFCRGYYTYAYLWAVSFDGKQIKDKWYHSSHSKTQYKVTANGSTKTYNAPATTTGNGSRTMYGNGNHNMSVGDVDGDGCDEIVWGSATLDHDGKMLSATGYGHGDAIHLADHNPDRPGLELFEIHEGSPYGWDLHDAATGEILFSATGGSDNGRGVAGNFYEGHRGSTFLSANDRQHRSAVTGKVVRNAATSMNFRIYWDDDPYEELLDGGTITKLTSSGISEIKIKGKSPYAYNNSSSCNGSKSTPNIVADLFGDWREELILWNSANSSTLNVFTSDIQTSYAAPTLMHDHLYRMGVAWQNVAYNQPPHLGYYLPDRFKPVFNFVGGSPAEQTVTLGDSIAPVKVAYRYTTYATVDSTFTPQSREKGLSDCFKRTNDLRDKTILIEGCPDQTGDYVVLFRMGGTASLPEKIYQQAIIYVVPPASIEGVHTADGAPRSDTPVHDLQGRRVGTYSTLSDRQLPKGIYIVGQKKYIVK